MKDYLNSYQRSLSTAWYLPSMCRRRSRAAPADHDRRRKSVLWTGPLTPDATGGRAFADQMARFADVGIDGVHVMPFGGDPVGFVQGLGEHAVGWLPRT